MNLASSPATVEEVATVLVEALDLDRPASSFDASTPLFGSLPELDSMAVVGLVAAVEDHFSITIDEDEVTAESFETIGSLAALVDSKKS